MWDQQAGFSSILVDDLASPSSAPLDIVAEHSVLSPIFRNGRPGSDDLGNLVSDQDPLFDNQGSPHYTLNMSSLGFESGLINGIPYDSVAPDFGVNQFTYSASRLVASIDTITPTCNLSDGEISVQVIDANKDLEFSLDDFVNDIRTSPDFTDVPAGEYIIYIRTADNCAHFQQKVTLEENCPADPCDPALEDSDNDGMTNAWEIANGLDECDPVDAFCDNDGDQVWNLYEYQLQTDPNLKGSPEIVQLSSGFTSQDLINEVVATATDGPKVIRIPEGTYTDIGLGRGFLPIGQMNFRFMIQGGWDAEFCDYDPYMRRTRFVAGASPYEFMSASSLGPSILDRHALILDGMEFQNANISCLVRFDKVSFSISNCSINNPDTNQPSSHIAHTSQVSQDFHFINSSYLGSNIFLYGVNGGSEMDLHLRNAVFTDNKDWGQTGDGQLYLESAERSVMELSIQNSIVWNEDPSSSILTGTYMTDDIGDNRIKINVEHSIMATYDLDDIGGRVVIDLEEGDAVFFENPQFSSSSLPYYDIDPSSRAVDAGLDNGLPYQGVSPDMGINQYAYSSIRLVERIDTISTTCNMSDGETKLTMAATNKDLEFSLDDFSNDIRSAPEFTDLSAGEYVIYIRTSDNCAHFQQKVTLTQDCSPPCDPAPEDSDNDGMPNAWEIANGLDECDPVDAFCDNDGDQVINLFEYQMDTDPDNPALPIPFNVDPSLTAMELDELISNNQGSPIVIRMSEGTYDEDFYYNNIFTTFPFDSTDRFRVMFQGGVEQRLL